MQRPPLRGSIFPVLQYLPRGVGQAVRHGTPGGTQRSGQLMPAADQYAPAAQSGGDLGVVQGIADHHAVSRLRGGALHPFPADALLGGGVDVAEAQHVVKKRQDIKALHLVQQVFALAGGQDHLPVSGLPEGGQRCFKCYRLRLEESARAAAEGGYEYFTTTLSVSPYKNAQKLNAIGMALAQQYGVKYLCSDFKKKNGYRRSIELSAKYGLYVEDIIVEGNQRTSYDELIEEQRSFFRRITGLWVGIFAPQKNNWDEHGMGIHVRVRLDSSST